MPELHLPFGGSTITRTLNCAGWRHHADRLPPAGTSEYAERGTRLHNIMEAIYDCDGTHAALETQCAELEADDAEAVRTAFDAAEEALEAVDAEELMVEPFVRLGSHPDIAGGSADLLARGPKLALVGDYKFGFMYVSDHTQLAFYALCAIDSFPDFFADSDRLVTAIIQPATAEPLRMKEWTADELAALRLDVERAIDRAQTSTETHAGPWCAFCPAAAICPARKKAVNTFLQKDPAALAELGGAMDLVADMKDQIKAVEAAVFAQLEAGQPVPGWKLVEKQKRRHWTDEAAVLERLRKSRAVKREQYVEEKLRSPAQVEKATKGALDLSEFIESRASGNTVAPASDKRPAVHTVGNVPAAIDAAMGKTD